MATKPSTQFVVCIQNDGYPASLEVRKLYPVVPDEQAGTHEYIRIIDESGEDYLYPTKYFMVVDLPPAVQAALGQVA